MAVLGSMYWPQAGRSMVEAMVPTPSQMHSSCIFWGLVLVPRQGLDSMDNGVRETSKFGGDERE